MDDLEDVKMIEWSEDKPNVFISYSWDDDAPKSGLNHWQIFF